MMNETTLSNRQTMSNSLILSSFQPASTKISMPKNGSTRQKAVHAVVQASYRKPLEQLYNVRVEKKVSPERLEELGVSRWSVWKTGRCRLPWDWHVDQLVYITEGTVNVVPDGCKEGMTFVAGDLVRYPKWFEADLFFDGPYEERYSFRAFGDD